MHQCVGAHSLDEINGSNVLYMCHCALTGSGKNFKHLCVDQGMQHFNWKLKVMRY